MNSQGILIVGGYGVVGRRIATELAADYPRRVVIGGRNPVRADEVARTIGHGVRGCKIDIAVPVSIAVGNFRWDQGLEQSLRERARRSGGWPIKFKRDVHC